MRSAWAVTCAADDCWTEERLEALVEALPGSEIQIVQERLPRDTIVVIAECSQEELEQALHIAWGHPCGCAVAQQEVTHLEGGRVSVRVSLQKNNVGVVWHDVQ